MACKTHGSDPTVKPVSYTVYKCAGHKRGCGSFGWPAKGGGPQDPCSNCGGAFARDGETSVDVGYCAECFPDGMPNQFLPSFIPIRIVGGLPSGAL